MNIENISLNFRIFVDFVVYVTSAALLNAFQFSCIQGPIARQILRVDENESGEVLEIFHSFYISVCRLLILRRLRLIEGECSIAQSISHLGLAR